MDFDLVTLRLLDAAVREGSITAAARHRNIAVSAVSRRFSELERQLGTAVLYRKGRGVEPTPAGVALLRHARILLRLAERAADEMSNFADGDRGHVRIAANPSAVAQFLPKPVSAFRTENPNVKIALKEAMSDDVVADVANGVVDIGVFSATVAHDAIETMPFMTDRLCVVAPAGHPIAKQTSMRFADLLNYPHVALEDGSSVANHVLNLADAAGRTLDVAVRVRGFDGVRRMVSGNLGLGVLPEGVARPYSESDAIAVVALDEPWSARQLLIGVREVDALSRPAARFLRYMLSSMEAAA